MSPEDIEAWRKYLLVDEHRNEERAELEELCDLALKGLRPEGTLSEDVKMLAEHHLEDGDILGEAARRILECSPQQQEGK